MITGGIAALVNFSSRILYSQSISFSSSIILAYLTGMVTAFLLAKIFVFKESTQSLHKSIIFFCLVNGLAIIQTWLVSMALFYYILPFFNIQIFTHEIAHSIGIVVPVFTSYIGHKKWSFKS